MIQDLNSLRGGYVGDWGHYMGFRFLGLGFKAVQFKALGVVGLGFGGLGLSRNPRSPKHGLVRDFQGKVIRISGLEAPAMCNKAASRDLPEMGFPKIRGTLLGVSIIRIVIFWGLY